MSRRSDGRHLIQITVLPDLYQQVKEHCKALDVPITGWVRELMRRELQATPTDSPR